MIYDSIKIKIKFWKTINYIIKKHFKIKKLCLYKIENT